WPMTQTRSPSSSTKSMLLRAWMLKICPAWLTLRVPTLARPNEGIRSKRNAPASKRGMRTLTSSILTRDMIALRAPADPQPPDLSPPVFPRRAKPGPRQAFSHHAHDEPEGRTRVGHGRDGRDVNCLQHSILPSPQAAKAVRTVPLSRIIASDKGNIYG